MNVLVRRLASELVRSGIQVDVFTRRSDRRTPEILYSKGARFVQLTGGPVRNLPKNSLPLYISELASAFDAFTRAHRLRYDVLHSHYWLSGTVALRTAQDSPLVHMFHTLARIKEAYIGGPDPEDTLLRHEGERAVLAHADVIVGATYAEQHLIGRHYGPPAGVFRVIPPGVDLELFRATDRDVAQRALGIEAEHVILFVGRMDPIKGLDLLLETLPALRTPGRLQAIVVGGDSRMGEGLEVYRHMARSLGIGKLVQFRGAVPRRKLPLYYSAADVCVVPSAYESFGMTAVESMACQTPVVAFRVGGLSTTIEDGQTGFLAEPGSRESYTTRLQAALESPNLSAMGCRAALSVQRYAWNSITRRTIELYDEAISARGDARRAAGD